MTRPSRPFSEYQHQSDPDAVWEQEPHSRLSAWSFVFLGSIIFWGAVLYRIGA